MIRRAFCALAVASAYAPATVSPRRRCPAVFAGGGGEETPISHEARLRRIVEETAPLSHERRLRRRRVLETHHLGFLERNGTLDGLEGAAKMGYSTAFTAGATAGERIVGSLREVREWAGWLVKANAMGLTEREDLTGAVAERARRAVSVATGKAAAVAPHDAAADADATSRDATLLDDWSNIHLAESPTSFYDDDDDDDDDDDGLDHPDDERDLLASLADAEMEYVDLDPGEWTQITSSAAEVDTQVIYDTVIKGEWVVKDGRTTFVRDET